MPLLSLHSTTSNYTPVSNDGGGTSSTGSVSSDTTAVSDAPDEEQDSSAADGYVAQPIFRY